MHSPCSVTQPRRCAPVPAAVITSSFNPVVYPSTAPGWVYDPTGATSQQPYVLPPVLLRRPALPHIPTLTLPHSPLILPCCQTPPSPARAACPSTCWAASWPARPRARRVRRHEGAWLRPAARWGDRHDGGAACCGDSACRGCQAGTAGRSFSPNLPPLLHTPLHHSVHLVPVQRDLQALRAALRRMPLPAASESCCAKACCPARQPLKGCWSS